MKTIIQINQYQYPIGWEWLHYVPLEDWQWLIDILATVTDNMETYDFAIFIDADCKQTEERGFLVTNENGSDTYFNYWVNRVDTEALAKFLDEDQGYEGGIREYGYYIAAKSLGIKSEEEYMANFKRIQQICNNE